MIYFYKSSCLGIWRLRCKTEAWLNYKLNLLINEFLNLNSVRRDLERWIQGIFSIKHQLSRNISKNSSHVLVCNVQFPSVRYRIQFVLGTMYSPVSIVNKMHSETVCPLNTIVHKMNIIPRVISLLSIVSKYKHK